MDTSVAIIEPIIASNAFGASYQWLDCSNGMIPILGATSQGYDVIQDGVYAVSVTQNACTDTSACVPMSLQSVTSLIDNTSIRLYPNPTDGLFHLDLGQIYSNVTIKITDIQGREIKREEYLDKQLVEMSLDEAEGLYLVQVVLNDKLTAVLPLMRQ